LASDADVAKASRVIERSDADFTPRQTPIAGRKDRLGIFIKPNGDVSRFRIPHDFYTMPYILFPRSSWSAICGDSPAVGTIHDMDLVMRFIGFFTEVRVIETICTTTAEGDAQVIVTFVP
jgi:hypothetical protein